MKLQRGLILSIVPLVIASCGGGMSSTQPNDGSVASNQSPVAQAETSSTQPENAGSKTTAVLKAGSFESGEQPTEGTVQLVRQGQNFALQFDQSFQTSTSGPDLVVVLHRSDNVLGSTEPPAYPLVEGEYTVLAPLQEYSGAQVYEIPDNVNIEDYRSAVIWCRQFNATFGAAVLQ